SLSLDAPVFAPAEPDVLTGEEPADFAETLHGPLDADAPAEAAENAVEMTAEDAAPPVEEIEAIDEIQPVAATGEFEAPPLPMPAPPSLAPAPAAEEPMEFEAEPEAPEAPATPELPSALPPTLPPTLPPIPPAPPAPAVVHEFSGVHEFDPEELDTPVAQTAETTPLTEPEAMTLPAELPTPEPVPPVAPAATAPAPLPEPEPEPPAEIQAAPAPSPAPAPSAEAGAFEGLGEPTEAPPAPEAAAVPAAAAVPSAEVAVPVDMVQQIAQRVISQVSERVIREIAWDVIPGLAEKLIRAEIEKIKARAESERD
ncbi:MAG: hypothetical protein K1Y01_21705, partial [Vicinamibacteria bacterium]|nr:hypothetical protein [Vicinamibacteria bacterium]